MKRISMLLFAVVVAATAMANTTNAQDQADNPQRLPQQAAADSSSGLKVISSLNIPSGEISERNERELTATFVVENNGDKAESNIRAGVTLFKILPSGAEGLIDQVFADEVFSLAPGAQVTKEVKYAVPDALKGTYSLGAVVANTSGLYLSNTGGFESFEFEDLAGSLYIEGCEVSIEGDTEKYRLNSGVDFSATENASIDCTVTNSSENAIPFVPEVSLYERALAGPLVETKQYSTEQMLPSESRKVTFYIPKVQKPQAYDIRIQLIHEEFKNILSNPVIGHFVIQGASATVQLVQLDKVSYKKGDTANVNAIISSQADYFGTSRGEVNKEIDAESDTLKYTATTTITSNGKRCADPVKSKAGAGAGADGVSLNVEVPITSNCPDAVAAIELTSANGDTLASAEFGGASQGDTSATNSKPLIPGIGSITKEDGALKPVVLAVIIISILAAIAILFMKKKNSVKVLLPIGLIAASLFLSTPQNTQAYVLEATQNDPFQSGQGVYQASILNYNILDNTCSPRITGDLRVLNCGNPDNDPTRGDACATVKLNGEIVLDVVAMTDDDGINNDGTAPVYPLDAPLPTDRSSFDLEVQFASHCRYEVSSSFVKATANRPYTAASCAGTSCGYTGGAVDNEPTNSQKCTNGATVTNNSFDGSRWTWSCDPTDGSGLVTGCYVDQAQPDEPGQCADTTVMTNHPGATTGCVRGTYVDIPDNATQYLWRCDGIGSGEPITCGANIPAPIVGECGSAETSPAVHTSFPTTGLCAPGKGGKFNEDSSDPTAFTWQCGGQNGGADSPICRANRLAPVAGSCGTAAGSTPVSAAPSSDLCANGDTPIVDSNTTNWFWVCPGENGGPNSPTCEVPVAATLSNGSCGPAANPTPVATAPTVGLCGDAATPVPVDNAGQWEWTCPGSGGGLDSPVCQTPVLVTAGPGCGADNGGTHLFAPPTQLCSDGSTPAVTQNGDIWEWQCGADSCSSTSNCGPAQYACGPDRCVSITVGGGDQANLTRDGSPVVLDQSIVTDPTLPAECQPLECELNGQSVPLGSVPAGIEIVHGDNSVTCRVPVGAECGDPLYAGDEDCDPTVVDNKQISCVCEALRCSAQGQCVKTAITASSWSASACSDDCSGCTGGPVTDTGL